MLRAIGGDVLRPDVAVAVVDGVLEALMTDRTDERLDRLPARAADTVSQEDRPADRGHRARRPAGLAAEGAHSAAGASRRAAEAIEQERGRRAAVVDRGAVERHVRERLADWQGLLTDNVVARASCCGGFSRGR